MAPLAARRAAEQVDLGRRVAAIELVVAAQAAELRGTRLGRGTGRAVELVRERLPFLAAGDVVPDVEPLVDRLRGGGFPDAALGALGEPAGEPAGNEG
jgi:histidine ammonia-lyase